MPPTILGGAQCVSFKIWLEILSFLRYSGIMVKADYTTKGPKETQKVAALLAAKIIRTPRKKAFVIALEGELGTGKTTFVQGFARSLGVKDNVLSPTFVLIKIYKLPTTNYKLKHLIHVDCYRIDSPKDLQHLGLQELLKDKDAVILIEWADRIRKLLPKKTMYIRFCHISPMRRKIIISQQK